MPVDYHQSICGVRAVIREFHPGDIPELIEALVSLSFESRMTRFLYDKKALSPKELGWLKLPSDKNHILRVAVISDGNRDKQIVGFAGCARVAMKTAIADVSVVVSDSWQRCGLGTQLTTELRNAALRVGITHWRADFFATNLGAAKLLGLAGLEERREDLGCGIVRVTVNLSSPVASRVTPGVG